MVHARPSEATRVGFVVSSAVGNAVQRNRIKRRLRHLTRPLVADLGTRHLHVVVRALPAAASGENDLAADLRSAWDRCLYKCGMDVAS